MRDPFRGLKRAGPKAAGHRFNVGGNDARPVQGIETLWCPHHGHTRCGSGNDARPVQGIETNVIAPAVLAARRGGNDARPVQGIETLFPVSLEPRDELVETMRDPFRGLKRILFRCGM